MAAREKLQGFCSPSQQVDREVLVDGSVILRHPGVGKQLFLFPAYSQPALDDPSRPLFGVYHRLVLDACRVLTNYAASNHGDFLAEDSEGKIPVPFDDITPLSPGDYYYFLGPPEYSASYNYPIVKDFSAFKFPSYLPEHWYRARPSARLERGVGIMMGPSPCQMSTHVTLRDGCCALTGYRSFNRCAHLVPEAEAAWFTANEMYLYSMENQSAGVCTHTNGVSLRADVHCCFESNTFVFYPAPGGSDAKFMAYFVHTEGYPEYTELFHKRLANIHRSVAVEFLYARFAYTVIDLWRPDWYFDSVPDNEDVKVVADLMALEKAERDGSGGNGKSEAFED